MRRRLVLGLNLLALALGTQLATSQTPEQSQAGPDERANLPRAAQGGPAPGQPDVSPEELIRRFDRDGDGRISREEAPPRMLEHWDQIDTNHDGYITLEELRARDARVGRLRNQAPQAQGGERGGGTRPRPGSGRAGGAGYQPVSTFSVITIGTGSPRYDVHRSGPCELIQYRGRYFLVDMGNGTQARLEEIGITPRQFDALLLTHHHLDHNEEFIPLFIHTHLMGGTPQIVGPPGTAKLVNFTTEFYAEDIAYRLKRVGRTMADFGHPAAREIQGGESFALGDVKVSTTRVNHTIHTVAYRFDVEGRSIVISGDLSYTEGLVTLAHGADVLVIDSGGAIVRKGEGSRAGGPPPGATPARGEADALHAHGSFQEVADMARKSGAKRLVLTHIAPGEVDEPATIAALGKVYPGEVIVGRDLMEVPAVGAPRQPATDPHAGEQSSAARLSPAAAATDATGTVPAHIAGPARVYVNASRPLRDKAGESGTHNVKSEGDSSADARDGKTWATAFSTIQAAIDAADRQGGGEVWVAAGTYYPTSGHDREATFQLRGGVALYGGFAGTESRLDQRDVLHAVSILSGDLGRRQTPGDNSYHVVTGADNAVLDGFQITGGYALEAGGQRSPNGFAGGRPAGGAGGAPGQGAIHTSPDAILSGANRGFGAGMLNFQCAPTVRNCTFQNNQAGKGGAVYNMVSRSFPPRRDAARAAPLFVACRFLDNHARGRGGAVANDLGTSPTLRGCTFLRNRCDDKGGAIYNDFGCSPIVVNCLFAENQATTAGAIGNDGGSSPRIVHCTFSRNVAAEEGAALYQGTGPANNPLVLGCILWHDRCAHGPAEIFNWHDNDPKLDGCSIEGGYPLGENMAKDPGFVDAAHDDYRLSSDSPCRAMGYTVATSSLPAAVALPPPPEPDRGPTAEAKPHAAATRGAILHVRAANTAGPWDGRSWRTAFATLVDALAAVGRERTEIWVAAGTYTPTAGTDREASFVLREGMELYGGFVGTETDRAQRDWKNNVTVLSGRIAQGSHAAANSFHVLIGADDAVLDGFVVRDGHADGRTYDGKGGGMINYRRAAQAGPRGEPTGFSPLIRHCVFTNNQAREGGAVYNYDRGAPQFVDCRFVGNSADYGGAMVDRVGVKTALAHCEFSDNSARWRAGAVYLDYGARPRMTDCRFQGNRSGCHGGALATVSRASQLESTIPLVQRCSFLNNTAGERGGAIANSDQSRLGLEDCTFSANQAGSGGGALANEYRARAVLVNCRFSGNRSARGEDDIAADASSTVSHERADWPDQASPARPAGLGGPP